MVLHELDTVLQLPVILQHRSNDSTAFWLTCNLTENKKNYRHRRIGTIHELVDLFDANFETHGKRNGARSENPIIDSDGGCLASDVRAPSQTPEISYRQRR